MVGGGGEEEGDGGVFVEFFEGGEGVFGDEVSFCAFCVAVWGDWGVLLTRA